jgi:hypothetical protein
VAGPVYWRYAHGGVEKLTFKRKIPPAPTVAAPPLPCKPGCPASERRRARDQRSREAWPERRINHSQPHPLTQSTAEEVHVATEAATAATSLSTLDDPASSLQPALLPQLATSPQMTPSAQTTLSLMPAPPLLALSP